MTKFETEIAVQPRDVDVNGHVHHSIYLDYLLAARYDQMERCYGISMEDFSPPRIKKKGGEKEGQLIIFLY